jgi:hypothetical protein
MVVNQKVSAVRLADNAGNVQDRQLEKGGRKIQPPPLILMGKRRLKCSQPSWGVDGGSPEVGSDQ